MEFKKEGGREGGNDPQAGKLIDCGHGELVSKVKGEFNIWDKCPAIESNVIALG